MSNINNKSVVCLMAPTASGKTALAYELYDTGRYEIVSVDSALIYRDMTIGTAKPSPKELIRYPHHLVDIIDPTQSYSVAEFVQDVQRLIVEIQSRGKIPLLVGGTMMYYMALFDGLSNVPDSEPNIREQVEVWRQEAGIESLHQYLAKIDPAAYRRLNPSDSQRITRAIEVFRQTGRPLSDWQAEPKRALAWQDDNQWHGLVVMPDRQWLHKRIAQRLDIMWEQGLVEEVVKLLKQYPLTPEMPSMRSVGYRQVLEYLTRTSHPVLQSDHLDQYRFEDIFLSGKDPAKTATVSPPKLHSEVQKLACLEMRNKALYATRQLAKRQYTWLRKLLKLSAKMPASSPSPSYTVKAPLLHNFNNIDDATLYLK